MMMMMTLGGIPSFRDGAVQHGRVHTHRIVPWWRREVKLLFYVLFVLINRLDRLPRPGKSFFCAGKKLSRIRSKHGLFCVFDTLATYFRREGAALFLVGEES